MRRTGTVVSDRPAGGIIETYDNTGEVLGVYYISNFDPLANRLVIGTRVSFKPTNPGDGRNVAEKVKVIKV